MSTMPSPHLAITSPSHRIAAIDRLRGIVMVIMASDHASHAYYADAVMRDTAFLPSWSDPLPTLPFLFRWLSHLCAPVFVFLAGASIALGAARCGDRDSQRRFDRDLLLRGLLLIALELSFISAVWGAAFETRFVCQVLWAIGSSMIAMIALRRLPIAAALALGALLAAGIEAPLLSAASENNDGSPGLPIALFVSGGFGQTVAVVYPTLPWLAVMLFGHAFGSHLARGGSGLRAAALGALLGLGTWFGVELGDGYGNLGMVGTHDSWLRWLQVSKYPPSLGFVGLELGLGCALLMGLFAIERRPGVRPSENGPLLVLGQTALFFYVLHIAILEGSGALLRALLGGDAVAGGLPRTLLATFATVALLWPAGVWFRAVRRRRAGSWLRLI
ncbi:MAG: DUF1624 domain-containing protein [Planctomycetes bacterium]|nr:DUF1624 domain-containing protein [Planctomycetota bacterium]